MSELVAMAKVVGSMRYARDIIEQGPNVTTTKPWWLGSAEADDYVAYATIRDNKPLPPMIGVSYQGVMPTGWPFA